MRTSNPAADAFRGCSFCLAEMRGVGEDFPGVHGTGAGQGLIEGLFSSRGRREVLGASSPSRFLLGVVEGVCGRLCLNFGNFDLAGWGFDFLFSWRKTIVPVGLGGRVFFAAISWPVGTAFFMFGVSGGVARRDWLLFLFSMDRILSARASLNISYSSCVSLSSSSSSRSMSARWRSCTFSYPIILQGWLVKSVALLTPHVFPSFRRSCIW